MFMHSLIHSLLYSAIIYGDPTMCQALEIKWRMRQTCCQETDILIEEGEQEKKCKHIHDFFISNANFLWTK